MHSIFRCEHGSFLCGSICGKSVVYSSWFNKSKFDEERDCMGKAILAMIVTVIVGYISGAIFANWVNAPEWGVILAVAVMGAFIIYFNDKKQ